MANPVSSSKILSYLLGASLGFINQSLNHSKYFAPKSDPSQYQYDDTPTPERNFYSYPYPPCNVKWQEESYDNADAIQWEVVYLSLVVNPTGYVYTRGVISI